MGKLAATTKRTDNRNNLLQTASKTISRLTITARKANNYRPIHQQHKTIEKWPHKRKPKRVGNNHSSKKLKKHNQTIRTKASIIKT